MTTELLRPGYLNISYTEDQCAFGGAVMSTELEVLIDKLKLFWRSGIEGGDTSAFFQILAHGDTGAFFSNFWKLYAGKFLETICWEIFGNYMLGIFWKLYAGKFLGNYMLVISRWKPYAGKSGWMPAAVGRG